MNTIYKTLLTFAALGNYTLLCAMDKETQLKDMDKDQQLAYYLTTNNKVDNIAAKVRALIDEGADVNRRITTQDQALKMVFMEQDYTPNQLKEITSDALRETWTPLISIACRKYTEVTSDEQFAITSALLAAGANPDETYQSTERPDMNHMTARNFAYQYKRNKNFHDALENYYATHRRK